MPQPNLTPRETKQVVTALRNQADEKWQLSSGLADRNESERLRRESHELHELARKVEESR